MIYFQTKKKDTGSDFIDINIPGNKRQLDAYYKTRKTIFCEEQGLFQGSDIDSYDRSAIPIVAINHYLGSPDEIVGVVRIYKENKQEWFGGRLGVMKEYRSFSKFICPHLFKGKDISTLYQLSVAAGLIYRAVSLAHYLGCNKFSAHVQEQNVKLFQRLHWNIIKEINPYGRKHFLMEADLNAYPPAPIHAIPIHKDILINLQKVA